MSTDYQRSMAVVAVAISIGVCAYFISKVDWSCKEQKQQAKPQTEKLAGESGNSCFDDQKNDESAELEKFNSKKPAKVVIPSEVMSRIFDTRDQHSDVEPVQQEITIRTWDEDDDLSISSSSGKHDTFPCLYESDSIHTTEEEILVEPPILRYKSVVADMFEESKSQEIGYFIGVKPVELCWHRGDHSNATTDYSETMGITWNVLAEINSTPTSFEVPQITSNEFRNLKRKLAIAFIEAMPSSRRNVSLLSVAVDKIWNEVTEFKKGEIRVNMVLFKKELAWLTSKKQKKQISLKDYKGILTTVTETPTNMLSFVSLDFGKGHDSRLELIKKSYTV